MSHSSNTVTRPRSRRDNCWIDFTIALVLIVIGCLIAFAGCDSQRACTCSQVCPVCRGVKSPACCKPERVERVESPDIAPTEHQKPPDADKLIGGATQEN